MARLWICIVCLTLAQAAHADTKGVKIPSAKELRDLAEDVREKCKLPALGVAVVTSSGDPVIAVTGVRKHGSKVKATNADRFHLGSDSKALTAVLIAKLVEEKKLSYDQTLGKTFADVKMHKDWKNVTLKMLLTHRAGLPDNLKGGWWKIAHRGNIRQQRELAVSMSLFDKPKSAGGETYSYSNLGYTIAAVMAERATKSTWEVLIQQKVFKPLKMTSAGFGPMGTVGKIDQPLQHYPNGKPIEPVLNTDNPPVMGPAGRIHLSLADWSKFVADQLKGYQGKDGLLKAASYKILHQIAYGDKDKENYTPGAWIINKAPGVGLYLTHDGSNTVNYCTALLLMDKDVAILVTTNQGGALGKQGCVEGVRTEVLKKLLKP